LGRNLGTLPPPQVPGAGSSSEQQQQPRRRPSPPLRLPSYSKPKRHASFDTPREVPLPSPSLLGHESQFSYFSSPMGHDSPEHSNRLAKKSPVEQQHPESFEAVFEERDAGWTSIASKRSTNGGQLHDLAQQMSTLSSPSAPSRSQSPAIATPSQPIHPFPRPYSLPHSQSSSAAGSSNGSTVTSLGSSHLSSKQAGGIDRSSSASLPLPSQIPFHTLPKVGSAGVSSLSQPPKHRLAGDADLSAPTAAATLGSLPETESEDRRGPSVSPTNFSTLPPTPPTTTDPSSLTSWLQSTVLPSTRPSSQPAFTAPQPPWLRAAAASPYHSTSTQRSSYPFVEPDYLDNASSYATALPKKTSPGSGLGMSRPPPEPPTILPAPPIPQEQHQYPPYPASAASPHTDSSPSTSGSSAASLASSTGMASTDTGLTSPASLSGSHAGGLQRSSSRASQPPAYAPFLSNAPPPADSWIEVETTGAEYRLNVRLPGFKRDGMYVVLFTSIHKNVVLMCTLEHSQLSVGASCMLSQTHGRTEVVISKDGYRLDMMLI